MDAGAYMFVSCVPSGLFTREFARLVGWTSLTESKYKYKYKYKLD